MRSGSGLRTLVDRCLAEAGVQPRVAQEVTQVNSALGLAIVPAYALRLAGSPKAASTARCTTTAARWARSSAPACRSLLISTGSTRRPASATGS